MRPQRIRLLVVALLLGLFSLCFFSVYSPAQNSEQVIRITAKRFVYDPEELTLKKGVPVVLEFTSLDVLHGFNCPDLGIRSDIPPNKTTTLRFVPQKTGTFPFHCDNFCGSGHEGMSGSITVKE